MHIPCYLGEVNQNRLCENVIVRLKEMYEAVRETLLKSKLKVEENISKIEQLQKERASLEEEPKAAKKEIEEYKQKYGGAEDDESEDDFEYEDELEDWTEDEDEQTNRNE